MFKRILVPLAERAVPMAARVARASGGSIVLLRVVNPSVEYGYWAYSMPASTMSTSDWAETDFANARDYLPGIASQLKLTVTWSVAFDDDVASAIIRVAENGEDTEGSGVFGGCDLIAISTHGRGGLQRWALGSVTERVLQGANLPLLIVRSQNHKPSIP